MSTSSKPSMPSTATSRALILVLALAGLAAATASTYVHYRLLTVPDFTSFCDVNSTVSCAQAYLSPYGELGGVPVAIPGALYFAAVLAIAGLGWPAKAGSRQAAPSYILALSIPALAFIAYLAYASFVVLGAFCILCAVSYVAVLGIAVVAWRTPRVPLGELPGRASRDLASAARNPVALLIAIVLAVGTVVAAKEFPKGNAPPAPAPTVAAMPAVSDAERERLAQWWELQPKEILPVDGGGAKVVVVKFNDYQCPLCGTTYKHYKPVFQSHGGAVRLVTKHYPLEGECNPGVNAGHFAACEAAAAVLMARARGTAERMEDWLFDNQPTLTPDRVKAAARDVAGIPDFDAQYAAALEEIRQDAQLGSQLKVNSTPTFFINGRRLPQTLEPQHLNVLLEIELKR
jgi:uncharacterized membrane protein/protein-disulfide isomerase